MLELEHAVSPAVVEVELVHRDDASKNNCKKYLDPLQQMTKLFCILELIKLYSEMWI